MLVQLNVEQFHKMKEKNREEQGPQQSEAHVEHTTQ